MAVESSDATSEHQIDDDEEASLATSVFTDMATGVGDLLQRVESVCRGVLSTAAAWAVRARDAIATMAHTTAAFTGFA